MPAQRAKNGVLWLSPGNIKKCNERGNEVSKRGSFRIVEQLACRFYSVSTRGHGRFLRKRGRIDRIRSVL